VVVSKKHCSLIKATYTVHLATQKAWPDAIPQNTVANAAVDQIYFIQLLYDYEHH